MFFDRECISAVLHITFKFLQVTYSKEGEDAEGQPLRDKLMSSVDSEVLAYDNYQSYNEAVFGTPEPPRALPSSEQHPAPGMSISLNC